ncbi:MAG: acetyltransferase [Clostridiaceae bacterium]|nr:acetyltransferase [Clostridiaceae bacterium]
MKKFFINTKRLGFSVWSEKDIPDALELWGNPEVTKFIVAGGKMSDKQVQERLNKEIENYSNNGIQYWPIYLIEANENIGCCGLRPYDDTEKILEIGIHLKEKYWGKGYAKEACSAVIAYAFNNLGVNALFAGHNPNNSASAGLLKKLGFTYTHDEFYPPTGLYHPSYIMKREDYTAMKGDIYKECAVYKTQLLTLRLSYQEDAEELLKCYSDEKAVPLFNSDNCHGDDFHYTTLERMGQAIDFWQYSYEHKYFVRFTVILNETKEKIGTVEMFKREEEDEFNGFGVLRIDLQSKYENQKYIDHILEISNKEFYEAFQVNSIITKAVPAAVQRTESLKSKGYVPLNKKFMIYDHYYVRNKKANLSFKINSLYVCVKDMNRAIKFYEKLLGQKVTERDEVYSVFDINGFRYGLFANDKVNEAKVWGNNCLPSLAVNDMDLIQQKIKDLNCPIVFQLTIIGKNKVLEFTDSEGNNVEVTCKL